MIFTKQAVAVVEVFEVSMDMSEREVNLVIKALFSKQLDLIEAACQRIREERRDQLRLTQHNRELWHKHGHAFLTQGQFNLLQTLACEHPGEFLGRYELARLAQIAPASVNVMVNKLRDELELMGFGRSDVIQCERGGYRWNPIYQVRLDSSPIGEAS